MKRISCIKFLILLTKVSTVALIVGCGCGKLTQKEPTNLFSEPMNILMISLDTLRADRLGCYGYDLPTSPFMDILSQQSILLTDVLAQHPTTILSHRSIFTGNYVFRQALGPAPETHTLAGILTQAGYTTAAFTDGGLMSARFGNTPGFELYNDAAGGSKRVFSRGIDWIDSNPEKPFFLFLHTYEVHYPYTPPRPYDDMFLPTGTPPYHLGKDFGANYWNSLNLERQDFIWISRRYDGGVRYVDTVMMDLWKALITRNLLTNTIIILFSDHGESLGERLFVGHRSPNEPQIHIPLIFHIPGQKHAVIDGAVESVDIAPTLLDLLSIKSDRPFCGRSLASNLLDITHLSLFRPRLSETTWNIWTRAFRLGPEWKLTLRPKDRNDLLYRLTDDPEEMRNLAEEYPEALEELRLGLMQFTGLDREDIYKPSEVPKKFPISMRPDHGKKQSPEMQQLQELGYIHHLPEAIPISKNSMVSDNESIEVVELEQLRELGYVH